MTGTAAATPGVAATWSATFSSSPPRGAAPMTRKALGPPTEDPKCAYECRRLAETISAHTASEAPAPMAATARMARSGWRRSRRRFSSRMARITAPAATSQRAGAGDAGVAGRRDGCLSAALAPDLHPPGVEVDDTGLELHQAAIPQRQP